MKRVKNKIIIAVLEKSGGLLKPASTKLNCSRDTLYEWINNDPELQKALETIRESMIDMSEGQMFKLIQEGNGDMIKFHLKTQGKKRGYVEKTEIDLQGNLNTKQQIEYLSSKIADPTEFTTEELKLALDLGIKTIANNAKE